MSAHTKFELDCIHTFSNNGRKPPFLVILRPIEGQNLANVLKKQLIPGNSPNKCTHLVWIVLREKFSR